MQPVLIGYFPKRRTPNPGCMIPGVVEEIASVSGCIAEGPDDWIEHWRHNELFVFDSPKVAWSFAPEAELDRFDLYGYAPYPVRFVNGQQQAFEIPPVRPQSLPADFERLGIDVVSRSCDAGFECSPLSCNGFAKEAAVNRWCLLDEIDDAFFLAKRVESSGAEPGPYYVLEVWRRRQTSRDTTLRPRHPSRNQPLKVDDE